MFALLLLLNLCNIVLCLKDRSAGDRSEEDFGTNLVASMRNDANLDLSADEEYEDLRAELLAYHTALASISSSPNRRSMMSTPCWSLGGICVDYKLCTGFRYLTEVPGCKDKLRVCCFAWNEYKVKDWRHEDIGSLAMPWSQQKEFGGLGVVDKNKAKPKNKKKKDRGNKSKLNDFVPYEENRQKLSPIQILNDKTVNRADISLEAILENSDQNIMMDNAQMKKPNQHDAQIIFLSQKQENTDDGEVLLNGENNAEINNNEATLTSEQKNNDNIDIKQLLGEINQEVDRVNEKHDTVDPVKVERNRRGKKKLKKKKALAFIIGQ